MSLNPGTFGIDYAGARPNPKDTASAGGRFIVRYSAGVGNANSNTQFKLCGVGEIKAAIAAGLDFIANSEWYESRITEGFNAGVADGIADLKFWQSRGLAKGASIFVSWDSAPNANLFPAVAQYLMGYNSALNGYYHVDSYAGDPALNYLLDHNIIKYGWRPNAGSWSNDPSGHFYQRKDLWGAVAVLSRAMIWQTGNYWFSNGADENILLRPLQGSHLWALAQANTPAHTSITVTTVEETTMILVQVDREECVAAKVTWPGVFLLNDTGLHHVTAATKTTDNVKSLQAMGIKGPGNISLDFYKSLGGS